MRLLKKLPLWLPAALWYRLIWGLSAQTAAVSGGASDGLLERLLAAISPAYAASGGLARHVAVELPSFYVRKGAHMFLYFVLAALVWLALAFLVKRRPRRAAAAALLCAALAALDEYHQTLVPGRSGEARDVLVDLLGALAFLPLTALPVLARSLEKAPRLAPLPWLPPLAGCGVLAAAGLGDPSPLFLWRARVTDAFLPLSPAERSALLAAAVPALRQALFPAACGLLGLCAACAAALTGRRRSLAAVPAALVLCAACALLWGLPLLPALVAGMAGALAGLLVWIAFPLLRR